QESDRQAARLSVVARTHLSTFRLGPSSNRGQTLGTQTPRHRRQQSHTRNPKVQVPPTPLQINWMYSWFERLSPLTVLHKNVGSQGKRRAGQCGADSALYYPSRVHNARFQHTHNCAALHVKS